MIFFNPFPLCRKHFSQKICP